MRHKSSLQSLFLITLLVNILPASLTSSFEPNASTIVLTIQTERTYYLRGEMVQILGTVKDTLGFPIQDATIAIEVKNPSSSTIFLDIVYSQSDGSYSDSFRLSSIASVGQYTVYATASKTGYNNATQMNFFYVTTNDLFIVSIEPIQVISDAEALIKNKKTAVRVIVANGFSERKWADIRITYDFATETYDETGPSETGVPLDVGLSRIYVPGGPAFPAQVDPWIEANQPPWFEWTTAGSDSNIRAIIDPLDKIPEAHEDNNEAMITRNIKESKLLRILVIPIYFPSIFQGPFIPQTNAQTNFLLATYPVADSNLKWVQSPPIPLSGVPPFPIDPDDNLQMAVFVLWLYTKVALPMSVVAKILGYDKAVIVVDNILNRAKQGWAGIAIGMPFGANRVPVIADNRFLSDEDLVAHEVGHTYDLWHPHGEGPPVYSAVQFWVSKREYEKPASTFMSYRHILPQGIPEDVRWIDEGRFESDNSWNSVAQVWQRNLFDQLKVGSDPAIVVLRGEVFRNGSAVANEPWHRLHEGVPDLGLGTSGNYSIVLLNQQHETLGRIGFNVSFTYTIDINGTIVPAETDLVPFVFSIPYLDGVYTIEIQNSPTGQVLVSRTISSNSPTLSLGFPNGGEVLAQGTNYTITWEASDPDMDPLTYSLAYSEDGGINWIPLALDLSENSYVWDTSQLASGNNYQVRVIASDGVNTGEDLSDGMLSMTIQGDIDGDFAVNVADLFALGKAYGTTPGSPNWNRNADINNDLIVNAVDLELLQKNYGKAAT